MLNIIDEFTRECLSITVNRKIMAQDVIDALFCFWQVKRVPVPAIEKGTTHGKKIYN